MAETVQAIKVFNRHARGAMTDRIFLKGLTVHAHHGVLEHEGTVGQRFVIDLEFSADLAKAAQSDRLSDTISYAAVAEEAQRAFTARKYKLLEASAEAVARAVLSPSRASPKSNSPSTSRTRRSPSFSTMSA